MIWGIFGKWYQRPGPNGLAGTNRNTALVVSYSYKSGGESHGSIKGPLLARRGDL
jgi:hypothetical protein